MTDELEAHCKVVRRRLIEGRVVPFLGAGASLCGRPLDVDPFRDPYLPSGPELATYLAGEYAYPQGEAPDLVRVSQYVHAVTGGPVLHDELHGVFSRRLPDEQAAPLPRRAAEAPALRTGACESAGQLVLTTNYDDVPRARVGGWWASRSTSSPTSRAGASSEFVHLRPDGEPRADRRSGAHAAGSQLEQALGWC